MIAACDVKIAKKCQEEVWGHTGGTLDKLESIPGFNIQVLKLILLSRLMKLGLLLLVKVLKLFLLIKNVCFCAMLQLLLDSIPLIASSIMAKKKKLKLGSDSNT